MARRLAAIMFTDIAGYTALSQRDEPAALRLLQDQERLVRGLLEVHRGRLVKSIGDGLLIEFPDALDAAECAVDLQRHIQERNVRELPPEIWVRIGIHLGDVEGVGPDILGDAVNIASRIEPLAEPGGICLTEAVQGQIRNKISFELESMGTKTLKGVQEPVEVYRVAIPRAGTPPPLGGRGPPRLAVLPLGNISSDAKDEYFADGLTEELITILSQIRGLRVIARTSVMSYKATMKPIAQIGVELGVDSVLEGTVRKAGDQLRITVQLIAASTQEHVWAQSYDRRLDNVFAIQTDVAKRIAKALKIKLGQAEEARLERRPAIRSESYLAYLHGRALISAGVDASSYEAAGKEFERAISLDSNNAAAYSGLADVKHLLGESGRLGPWDEWVRQSRQLALRALELDPNLADAHASLGALLWHGYDYVGAEKKFRMALSLDPSRPLPHLEYALLLADSGRTEEALREFALAEESDPHSPTSLNNHALVLIRYRRLDEARAILDRRGRLGPETGGYRAVFAFYHMARSEYDRASEDLDLAEQLEPGEWWDRRIRLFALSGNREKAESLLAEVEQKPDAVQYPQATAMSYALLGNLDHCFRWLGKSIENHSFSPRSWLGDPALEAVRKDPRFGELLRKVNLG